MDMALGLERGQRALLEDEVGRQAGRHTEGGRGWLVGD